jgi:hypothetical protein
VKKLGTRAGDEHARKKNLARATENISLFFSFFEIHRYFELGFLTMIKGSNN